MAVYLNGTSQYLSGGPTVPSIATNWSCSVWVYSTNFSADAVIAGVSNSGGLGLGVPDSATLQAVFYTVNAYTSDALSLSATTWNHFLFTKNGSTLSYKVNNVSKGSDTVASFVAAASGGLYVGARNSGGTADKFLPGRIAELAFWDADVSASSGTLYTGAAAGAPATDVGTPTYYWPLDTDGTATVGGFDLTPQGSPSFTTHASAGLTISGGGGGSSFKAAWLPRNQSSIGSR